MADPGAVGPLAGLRVLVAGHDLKFARLLIAAMQARGARVATEQWHGHGGRPDDVARDEVDVVLCEWMLGNAVHHSVHPVAGRRLLVRFHRQELETDWPHRVDLDAVERIVFPSDHVRAAAIDRFDLDPDRCVLVPNAVDTASLALPKHPDAATTVGLLGWVPASKRIDRALDLVQLLRRQDPRYRLEVKGATPGELGWVLHRPAEREYFTAIDRRLDRHPSLREAVTFVPAGDDVAEWLRSIGWVLSPSDHEGFHLAPVEAMASGSVALVWERAGAEAVFGPQWLVPDTVAAAETARARAEQWPAWGSRAAESVRRYDIDAVMPAWVDLLTGRT